MPPNKFKIIFLIWLACLLAGCRSPSTLQSTPTSQSRLTPTGAGTPLAAITSTPIPTALAPTQPSTQSATPKVLLPTLDSLLLPTPTATLTQPPTPAQATPEPTSSASPTLPATQSGQSCTNKADFYEDVTLPDNTVVEPGQALVKTWRIRNSGDCTWENTSLVYASGELLGAPISNPLPTIQAGEIVNISVNMVAPQNGGQYTSNWRLSKADGTIFGFGPAQKDYIWVTIKVDWKVPTPASGNTPPPSGGDCGVTRNQDYESQVLNLINTARAANGLKILTLQPQLTNAALEHSLDMACKNYVGHTGSDGSNWNKRVAAQGYANSNSARENIYVGDPAFGGDPAGAFDWWMNSQVHRDNILFEHVSEVGIAYVYYAGSNYGGYYTVVFARP